MVAYMGDNVNHSLLCAESRPHRSNAAAITIRMASDVPS